MPLIYATHSFSTELSVSGGITDVQTTGIVFQDVSGVDTSKPGLFGLTWSNPVNPATYEICSYTSISGNEAQGVVRGVNGTTAKAHNNGAVVMFSIIGRQHVNQLVEMFEESGLVAKEISTPTSPAAGYNKLYFKNDDKLYKLTSGGTETEIGATTPVPRTNTVTSHATPSINVDTTDIFTITAQAEAITSMTTNLTGTPVNGQKLIIRILDNGTARAITWGASYVSRGATLPTTTVLGKYLYVGLIYNSTASKWDCVAAVNES